MRNTSRYLVFTDLDGTLLDHDTYSWDPARPAIQRLIDQDIPWVFVTSKTRAETEVWRAATGNRHPFIVENGGAAFFPSGYFSTPVAAARRQDGYDVVEWGLPYARLVAELKDASERSGCRVRGFHDMSVAEIASQCALSADFAALAKQREYDEPFVVLNTERSSQLSRSIASRGLKCTQGGRFWHIMGANDKGSAVRALRKLYEQERPDVITIGLGDGLNDAAFLAEVKIPVVIRSKQSDTLGRMLPHATVTAHPGPAGWAEALLSILPEAE